MHYDNLETEEYRLRKQLVNTEADLRKQLVNTEADLRQAQADLKQAVSMRDNAWAALDRVRHENNGLKIEVENWKAASAAMAKILYG